MWGGCFWMLADRKCLSLTVGLLHGEFGERWWSTCNSGISAAQTALGIFGKENVLVKSFCGKGLRSLLCFILQDPVSLKETSFRMKPITSTSSFLVWNTCITLLLLQDVTFCAVCEITIFLGFSGPAVCAVSSLYHCIVFYLELFYFLLGKEMGGMGQKRGSWTKFEPSPSTWTLTVYVY